MSVSKAKYVSLMLMCAALVLPRLQADDAKAVAQHERWVTAAVFTSDGSKLISAGGQSLQFRPGDIVVWDAKSGKQLAKLEGHKANIWSIALSADDKTMVSSSYNGEIIVWDVAAGKSIATVDKIKGWIRAVAITSDGKHFAAAAQDGNVTAWSVEGPKEVKTFKAHESAVYALAFSPDGQTLATASTDKTAKLWDWKEGKEKAKLEGHDDAVWSVAFSADGSRIATSGADRKIVVRDANGKPQASLYGHGDWVSMVRFSPDGKSLASSSLDRSVRVWNLDQATKLAGQVEAAVKKVADTRKAIDEGSQKVADAQKAVEDNKKKVDVVAAIGAAKEADTKHKEAQAALDADKENKDLIKARDDAKKALDAANKSRDDKIKAFASDKEFTKKLNDLKGGELEPVKAEQAKMEKESEILAAKVKEAENAKTAAEKALDGVTASRQKLYDQQSSAMADYKSTVWAVAFSPDGKLLATGSQRVGAETGTNTLRVWNVAEKKELFPAPTAEPKKEEAKE